jgi:hypothetical protein
MRSIKTDFEASWDDEYDPLSSLVEKLTALHENNCEWWKLRDPELPHIVHYPVTQSYDEWAEELLKLDQLVIEGFEEKALRLAADLVGRKEAIKELEKSTGSKLRGLKLIEQSLIGMGLSEKDSHEVLAPFHEIHNYRSILKGHARGSEATRIEKLAIKEFKSVVSVKMRTFCF